MARAEKRKAKRYRLAVPVAIGASIQPDSTTLKGTTRDISTKGVYFLIERDLKSGNEVNLTMTLPAELTGATDVLVNVTGKIVRIEGSLEEGSKRVGVGASIDRYEIVRSDVATSKA